jgi:hypothetical protein
MLPPQEKQDLPLRRGLAGGQAQESGASRMALEAKQVPGIDINNSIVSLAGAVGGLRQNRKDWLFDKATP